MKIRTQLAAAFLLLAILPLTGIVLYSYVSSLRAVRRAAEVEAGSLTREMDGRMAAIRTELGQGLARVGRLSPGELLTMAESGREGRPAPELGRLVRGFGEAAPLLQSVEFIPGAPPPTGSGVPVPPEPPGPPASAAVVIDVPSILRNVEEATKSIPQVRVPGLSEEQRRKIQADVEQAIEQQAKSRLDVAESRREAEAAQREMALSLGRRLETPVWIEGTVVGTVKVRVRQEEVLRRVLARTRKGEGEVPFALDSEGKLSTIDEADRRTIAGLGLDLAALAKEGATRRVLPDWVVVTSKDADSGLTFGIARPVPLKEVRKTAARNFGYGVGLIGLALLGILPLSGRITKNLRGLTEAAERIARGDLDARVPVRSNNEIGTLAAAFNRMAHDLRDQQDRLLEEERRRRESEIEQRLLKTEYERKTEELEEARQFQLSLLPKTLPAHPGFEVAVSMRTATEVGGDYYDFLLADDGILTAAIGDATGHGATAGTMVTAIKSLFSAYAGGPGLAGFLAEAARAVRRMDLGRMAMALSLVRLEGKTLTVSAAGMPPVLLYRRETGRAEEIALPGMPLGGLAFEYQERKTGVAPGDTILLLTDGLPELTDAQGDPLGYARVRAAFEALGERAPEEVIAGLTETAGAWAGEQAAGDDITLVVIKVR
ncbi:MAG TPA: SpoIIE family protein phosphatase [Thermoanaerobaculia bacterium]|nr:SpoIIE family protein phosphatase [Thermoanaerobaculia bacterium]